jgi:hypothetical protein
LADKIFTGTSLEQALRDGSLEAPRREVSLLCMVKASDKPDHVSVTTAGCEQWLEMPARMIEQAEVVGHRSCKDHEHPLVRITLKQSGDDETQLLAALLGQLAPMAPTTASFPGGFDLANVIAQSRPSGGPGTRPTVGGISDVCWNCLLQAASCEGSFLECYVMWAVCMAVCDDRPRK